MEKGIFTYEQEAFLDIIKQMTDVKEKVNTTYDKASKIKEIQVDNYKGWQGKQKEELSAFLDLTLQYHAQLIEGENSPTASFCKTLENMAETMANYTNDSKSYQNLMIKGGN